MHRESISVKNFIELKPQMFSPVNLSTSMVCKSLLTGPTMKCLYFVKMKGDIIAISARGVTNVHAVY